MVLSKLRIVPVVLLPIFILLAPPTSFAQKKVHAPSEHKNEIPVETLSALSNLLKVLTDRPPGSQEFLKSCGKIDQITAIQISESLHPEWDAAQVNLRKTAKKQVNVWAHRCARKCECTMYSFAVEKLKETPIVKKLRSLAQDEDSARVLECVVQRKELCHSPLFEKLKSQALSHPQ